MGRGMQYFQCMQQFVICQHLIVNHPKYDRNDFNPEIGPSTLGRFADTAGDSHVMEEFEGLWAGYVLNGLQTDARLATVGPSTGQWKESRPATHFTIGRISLAHIATAQSQH